MNYEYLYICTLMHTQNLITHDLVCHEILYDILECRMAEKF